MSSRGSSSTNELGSFGAISRYKEITQIGPPNRYEEAPQMEKKYAEYWANKDGRTLKRITSQTCDGGKDFIGIENGNKVIGEVKHWGRPVDKYTLLRYVEQARQEDVDLVIGATNGLTDPAEELAKKHVAETIVGDDLCCSRREQIINTLSKFAQSTVDATRGAANMVREFVVERILMATWNRWRKLSTREKIVVGMTVVIIAVLIYYGREYHKSSDKSDSFFEWLSMRFNPS